MSFSKNLRSELDYQGLIVKQLSAKTGININTLNHYLYGKKSIPPADIAVKIAIALGVSVEYLVTGEEKKASPSIKIENFSEFRKIINNLQILPEDIRIPIFAMIETAAKTTKKKYLNSPR